MRVAALHVPRYCELRWCPCGAPGAMRGRCRGERRTYLRPSSGHALSRQRYGQEEVRKGCKCDCMASHGSCYVQLGSCYTTLEAEFDISFEFRWSLSLWTLVLNKCVLNPRQQFKNMDNMIWESCLFPNESISRSSFPNIITCLKALGKLWMSKRHA